MKTPFLRRCSKACFYTFACLAVTSAVVVSLLRASLPYFNQYYGDVIDWFVAEHNITIKVDSIDAGWHRFSPVLVVNTLGVQFSEDLPYDFDIQSIKLNIDVWNSLLEQKILLENLILDGVDIKFPVTPFQEKSGNTVEEAPTAPQELTQILDILLRQLGRFELTNSRMSIVNPSGEEKTVLLKELTWVNDGNHHVGEGIASVENDLDSNNLQVIIDVESDKKALSLISGDIYVQAEDINVSHWLEQVLLKRQGLKTGLVNAEAWINLKKNKPTSLLVKLNETSFGWRHNNRQQQFDIDGGLFEWKTTESGWQLDSYNLAFRSNGIAWPALSVQVRQDDDDLFIVADQIQLENLSPIFALSRHIDDELFTHLYQFSPQGMLDNAKIRIPLNAPESTYYSAKLSNFSSQPWQGLPNLNHVNLQTQGSLQSGHVALSMDNAELDVTDYFLTPMMVNHFKADLDWTRYRSETGNGIEITGEHAGVETPELVVNGQFLLDIPENGSAFLSMSANADLKKAGLAYQYYPTDFMGDDLIGYLRGALQKGQAKNAQLLWFGEFGDYPYEQGNGIFQAKLSVDDAIFQFDPEWPAVTNLELGLLFENDNLFLFDGYGDLKGVDVIGLSGDLLTLGDAQTVNIATQFGGTGKIATDLILESPLTELHTVLTDIKIQKAIKGSLNLKIPLSDEPVAVSGDIDLENNDVYLSYTDFDLSNVVGKIGFNDKEVWSEKVSATLWKQPVEAVIQTEQVGDDFTLSIGVNGLWNTTELLTEMKSYKPDFVSGSVHWSADLNLQVNEVNSLHYEFDLKSDLEGLNIAMPAPFTKYPMETWATSFALVGNNKQANFNLLSGKKVMANGLIDYDIGPAKIVQSLVQVGQQDEMLTSDDLNAVVITANTLDIETWLDWYNQQTIENELSEAKPSSSETPLNSISIAINKTAYKQQPINDLSLLIKRYRNQWILNADSKEMTGQISLPDNGPIVAGFSKIHLPLLAKESEVKETDKVATTQSDIQSEMLSNDENKAPLWQQIPSLDFICDSCEIGKNKLGKVDISLRNTGKALQVERFNVDMSHSQLTANGTLTTGSKGKPFTRVSAKLKSESLEKVIADLGQKSPFVKTPADVDVELTWHDEFFNVDSQSLSGKVTFKGKSGRIDSVSDKGTRFLSLLSVQSLVKKLSLDFSDVFNGGISYDSMGASVYLIDGVATNDDFIINSSSGKIAGSGSYYMASEEIDYTFSFYPDVTSSLPVLTAFAVTPVTAVAVFALSKLLEPVVNVITEVKFKVTGNVNDMQFTEVERNEGEVELPSSFMDSLDKRSK